MSSSHKQPTLVRRATPGDIEAILNLLTDYGLPRSYFEPFYLNDSSYRPEQSWVVEQDGRLVSHIRIYDRWMYVGQTKLHIAGLGNVITAPDARGSGHAGRLLRAMLSALEQEDYAYSLLWTHLLDMYSRYGWVAIEQELVRAMLPPTVLSSAKIEPFRNTDLPAIMQLYESANTGRTGAIIRSPQYWREQPTWLREEEGNFLVARDMTTGTPVGYVRNRTAQSTIEILELGIERGSPDIGRSLLTTASLKRDGQLQGQLPPSLTASLFLAGEFSIIPDPGLMGRVLNLDVLLRVLAPAWEERVRTAGLSEGSLPLATSAGHAHVQVINGQIHVYPHSAETAHALHEREFAHLLFHGFDKRAQALMGTRPDVSFLRVLFPEQDFAIWQADAF
ncbi:MAG: GNAT family N-acetyltransferase [Ktedonobacteraceae bacterium]